MFRLFHRWAGVPVAIVLVLVCLTGAVLSVYPTLSVDRSPSRLDAGHLIAAVQTAVPGAEQITVDDNGNMTAVTFGANGLEQYRIDPATGASLGPVEQSGLELWFEDFHRALFLEDTGRMIVLVVTFAMIVLGVSGYSLAARRAGGWRKLFARDPVGGASGWHFKLARIAGIGLLVSAISGLWMGLSTLGLVPDTAPFPAYPAAVSAEAAMPADTLDGLIAIKGDTLRAVTLPRAGLTGQPYLIETDAGAGYYDPVTGDLLSWADCDLWGRIMDVVHLLHTGQGAAVLALTLGVATLTGPVLSVTGVMVWLNGRQTSPKAAKVAPEDATLVVLVGSEGGTTWQFANALAATATAQGQSVFIGPMSGFAPETYRAARAIALLAATYGEGDAPDTARDFLERLEKAPARNDVPVSVLGFGDRGYARFCAYAARVTEALRARGWHTIACDHTVDRQSSQDFGRWATDFGDATGIDLTLAETALGARKTTQLTLVSIRTWGEASQAPTAVLRFTLPKVSLMDRLTGRGFARFEAGDILNVFPENDDRPRSYSLASGRKDGFVEICVRKQPGGLCSTQLCNMAEGDTVTAYVKPNPAFHADRTRAPLILIGAGAGVGALAGFVRGNHKSRPVHLYFGTRSPKGGYPYQAEFAEWRDDGRLTSHDIAYSRGAPAAYVQNILPHDAARIAQLVSQGARIMVCGGRDMANGVRAALDEILAPTGATLAAITAEGRYVEDVF